MKRYVIERDIPGIGGMTVVELCGVARASNAAIGKLDNKVQWQHSYVADNRTYCIYIAECEEVIRRHAGLSGLRVGRITEIGRTIDPLTATN